MNFSYQQSIILYVHLQKKLLFTMKSFFKVFFAVVLAIFFTFFLFFILLIGVAASSGDTKPAVSSNSILALDLNGTISDFPVNDPFSDFSLFNPSINTEGQIGLFELKSTIEKAKDDKNIKGILLKTDGMSGGISTIFEVKRILEDFKKSGKFIIAYTEGQEQGSYLVNTVADKIYMNPMGMMELKGLGTEITYFKGLMDKVGVEPMIFYAGEFKSATEPYRLTQMSEENRAQMTALLNDIYTNYLLSVAKSRNLSTEELRRIIDNLSAVEPEQALSNKLIDGIKYYDELLAELAKKVNIKDVNDLKFTTYKDYKIEYGNNAGSKDKIAVLFAEGDIVDGDGESGQIASEKYVEYLKEIKKDKNVKAIVLRVNSPGGSAYASEQIWREIDNIKKERKIPVVVSMGDLAASGGYYIAAPADYIFAEENTITGSIGVFGMMFNTEKMFREKAGITFDRVKTAPYADFGNSNRPWTDREKEVVANSINRTYTIFKNKVVQGRKLPQAKVDSIARGRVWSGEDAKELGLVDEFGNIDAAIQKATQLAKLKDPKLATYPGKKSYFENLMEDFEQTKTEQAIRSTLGTDYELYKSFTYLRNIEGIQARLPFTLVIE